ncbi:MAG: hypothetical protein H0V66_15790 [Bdellovibrionales bacterium]|nr:hypothetical protein [Bdellovibrionales bacterium]
MSVKVLVLNPEVNSPKATSELVRTSWDEESFWIPETFSFSQVFAETEEDLSPFMLIDARLSFLISLIDLKSTTWLKDFPPLACVLFALRSKKSFASDSDVKKYWNEYTRQPLPDSPTTFSQVVTFTALSVDEMARLELGAVVFLAGFENKPTVIPGFIQEAECIFEEDSELGKFFVLKLKRSLP